MLIKKEMTFKVDSDGCKHWYINGKLHREDGPAKEYLNGNKEWYKNGKLHREDGPAVDYSDGNKHWYKDGKRHREDGPAIEWSDGHKAWYINGEICYKCINECCDYPSLIKEEECNECSNRPKPAHKRC